MTTGGKIVCPGSIENRLLAAPTAQSQYRYDALGRRVQKTVAGWSTTFVPFGAQVFTEISDVAVPEQAQVSSDGSLAGLAGDPLIGGLLEGATGAPGSGVVRINFQTPVSAIPEGFLADKGRERADRDVLGAPAVFHYGWEAPAATHARGTPLPLVADTLAELAEDQHWELSLPNGTYPVLIVAGDATRRDRSNHLRVNGELLVDPTPNPGPDGYLHGDFDVWAVEVTVTDGRLIIAPDASADDASLVWVEIGIPGYALPDPLAVEALATMLTESTWQLSPADDLVLEPTRRSYVYGSYVDHPLMTIDESTGISHFYHVDHRYSVQAITDDTGTVVERYSYTAYGAWTILDAAGTPKAVQASMQPYGYTGRRFDAETDLWYFRARYFDAELGRFISRDPLQYVDGYSMYRGYFVPGGMDPYGFNEIDVQIVFRQPKIGIIGSGEQIRISPPWQPEGMPYEDGSAQGPSMISDVQAAEILASEAIAGSLQRLRERLCENSTIRFNVCYSANNPETIQVLTRILNITALTANDLTNPAGVPMQPDKGGVNVTFPAGGGLPDGGIPDPTAQPPAGRAARLNESWQMPGDAWAQHIADQINSFIDGLDPDDCVKSVGINTHGAPGGMVMGPPVYVPIGD